MKLKQIGPNMTEVRVRGLRILFSYSTPVAYINDRGGAYKTPKHHSRTTTGHINRWLNTNGVIDASEALTQNHFDEMVAHV